jgi:hypothetical protein
MTPDDLVERVARKIAAHVGAEKFWGLYKDTAQDIVDIALREAAKEIERLRAALELFECDCEGEELCFNTDNCRNFIARTALSGDKHE